MFWSISTNRNEGADPTIVWDKLKGKQVFQLPEIWDGTVSAADGPPSVRLVCISDTHGRHQGVVVPPGDVLLHSGDFSDIGAQKQVESFRDWLLHQKALNKTNTTSYSSATQGIFASYPFFELKI